MASSALFERSSPWKLVDGMGIIRMCHIRCDSSRRTVHCLLLRRRVNYKYLKNSSFSLKE